MSYHQTDLSTAVVLIAVAIAAMLLSWIATTFVRLHTIRNAMFDVPNQRSSHSTPTPRGGGAAIASVALVCVAAVAVARWLPYRVAIALLGGGGLVAIVGWLDDRHHVNAAWRAVAHICAATWAIAWLGGVEYVRLGHLGVIAGYLSDIIAVLAIVWMTNLYNFMDGIDGLAAIETIFVGAVGSGILLLGGTVGLAVISASLAGAAAGFFIWNRMPARIFMGDVGSGFLGFSFAVIAISAHKTATIPAIIWVLLLLVFIMDATTTLLRRVLRGEPWHMAHRLHAYQRLAQSGLNHAQVVTWVALLNVFLSTLAVVVFFRPGFAWLIMLLGLLFVTIAYIAVERRRGMWM